MCIKPNASEKTIISKSDIVQSLVPELTKHRVRKTTNMPKKYHPYQATNDETKKEPKVVCRNIGSNGTVFIVEDEEDAKPVLDSRGSVEKVNPKPRPVKSEQGIVAFVAILLHALACR